MEFPIDTSHTSTATTLTLTGAEALARAIKPEQPAFVFGVAGGKIAPLLKCFATDDTLRYIGVRHEAAAAYMAAAIFAATGRMAIVFSEIGPGTSNTVPGIASAYNNRLPLLLISSNNQHAAAYPFRGMFMELDNAALLRPITKWNAVVHDGRRIPELVRQAYREALTGRPGPVHLDVPQDILLTRFEYPAGAFEWPPASYRAAPPAPDPVLIARAADMLGAAARPVLLAGGGVVRAGAAAAFAALGHALGAPMITTQSAIGAVPSADPLCLGQGGLLAGEAALAALREADVVLAAGCRFSSWLWDVNGPLVAAPQRLIHIDVDAATLGHVVPAAVPLLACAGLALQALVRRLQGHMVPAPRAAWAEQQRAAATAWRAKLAELASERSAVMHPAALAAAIGAALPADALVTFDGGHTSFWSNDFTPVSAPATRFHEPGLAQLGFGLPYAIALAAACPNRPAFNITGDGAFGFTVQELDTARRYGLPVITLIHNNESWGVIASGQKRQGFSLGTDLSGTDYAAIGRGFGCHGATVTAPEQIAPAIAAALTSGLPAVIDCRTRFVPHPMMPVFGGMGQVGIARETH